MAPWLEIGLWLLVMAGFAWSSVMVFPQVAMVRTVPEVLLAVVGVSVWVALACVEGWLTVEVVTWIRT